MTERTDEERGPGLEGQESGEGGVRPADAAVATDKEAYHSEGEWAGGLEALDGETAATLVAVTRAMYPHDRIPDEHYSRVVEELDLKAASDGEMATLLREGIANLTTVSGAEPGAFAGLDEGRQTEALEKIQDGAFFKAVASEVSSGLYSQPDVWPYFGYEGPSNDKGGYVHRGFDDIDWLDEAPDRRQNRVEERVDTEERINEEG